MGECRERIATPRYSLSPEENPSQCFAAVPDIKCGVYTLNIYQKLGMWKLERTPNTICGVYALKLYQKLGILWMGRFPTIPDVVF